jgi:hypothetical protein
MNGRDEIVIFIDERDVTTRTMAIFYLSLPSMRLCAFIVNTLSRAAFQ